jgi:hypothetical protein
MPPTRGVTEIGARGAEAAREIVGDFHSQGHVALAFSLTRPGGRSIGARILDQRFSIYLHEVERA